MQHGGFRAVSVFVSAYLVSHNILYPSVMFWQQNIIPQSLSGCHFTKAWKITKNHIHMWENKWERERGDGVKHDFHPQLCPQELLCLVFSFDCADKSARGGHHCPTSYHSFSIPIPSHIPSRSDIPDIAFSTPVPSHFHGRLPPLIPHVFAFLRLSPPPSVPPSVRTLRHVVIVWVWALCLTAKV